MTPKEKAKELVKKFICIEISLEADNIDYKSLECELRYNPKQFALIAVDEIIKALNNDIYIQGETDIDSHREYWLEVQKELQEL